MIEVTNVSREFSKIETYLMTSSPAIISMKDVPDDTSITVRGYLEFKDVKESTGEVSEIMSVITPDNTVYSCQSSTFKRSLKDIDGIMDGQEYAVKKVSGVTKAGRGFINCILDLESLESGLK